MHLFDDVDKLRLQFLHELIKAVMASLNLTELLLPNPSQFRAFQHLSIDDIYQFTTCLTGNERLFITSDIASFEQRLDDACTTGRTANAVFLHRLAQGFVVDQLSGCFHRLQQ